MKSKFMFLVTFVTLFFLSSCKTDEEKRKECEDIAEKVITEWWNANIKGNTKTRLNNFLDLIEEYGRETPYKTFNHLKHMESDTEGFVEQITKDMTQLIAAEKNDRYKETYNYELEKARIWYTNNKPWYYDNVCDAIDTMFVKRIRSIRQMQEEYSLKKMGMEKELDSDVYEEELRDALYNNDRMMERISVIKDYEYLLFVTTEYEYPALKTSEKSFEGGYQSSRLKIFRIRDKKCLLDKRIFAATPDEVWTIRGGLGYELQHRMEWEILFQAIKLGLPYKNKT